MFITPRVVENETDVRRIIDDLRRRMERLDQMFPVKNTAAEAPQMSKPSPNGDADNVVPVQQPRKGE